MKKSLLSISIIAICSCQSNPAIQEGNDAGADSKEKIDTPVTTSDSTSTIDMDTLQTEIINSDSIATSKSDIHPKIKPVEAPKHGSPDQSIIDSIKKHTKKQ